MGTSVSTMDVSGDLDYFAELQSLIYNSTWTNHEDSLDNFSPAAIIGFGLLNVILMLGTLSSFAPLPGHTNGGLWPIFVKEHYSAQTSQHPLDPYSIGHVNHGVLGFLLSVYLGADLGIGFMMTIASAVLWEILENTKFVI